MPNKQHKLPGGPGAGGVESNKKFPRWQHSRALNLGYLIQLGRGHPDSNAVRNPMRSKSFPPLHPTFTQPLPLIGSS